MLAYVFWHTRGSNGDSSDYERALADFQRTLAQDAPPGFLGCAAHALDGATWLPGDEVYEDWYLVDGWDALGVLNEAAVDARRRATHDVVAAAARHGAGGVYALSVGEPSIATSQPVLWLDKQRGVPYPEFRAELARLVDESGGVWERQLVLGPTPEFCVVARAGAEAPVAATVVNRRAVFAS